MGVSRCVLLSLKLSMTGEKGRQRVMRGEEIGSEEEEIKLGENNYYVRRGGRYMRRRGEREEDNEVTKKRDDGRKEREGERNTRAVGDRKLIPWDKNKDIMNRD